MPPGWIEETKFTASASVGWTVERTLEADSIIVQIRHDTEFFVPLAFGDPVEIIRCVPEPGWASQPGTESHVRGTNEGCRANGTLTPTWDVVYR